MNFHQKLLVVAMIGAPLGAWAQTAPKEAAEGGVERKVQQGG